MNKVIAISDCDHQNINEEQDVCQKYNIRLDLFQCKTESDVIRQLRGYNAVINQYAPFTERVFAALPELKMIVRYGVGVNNIDLISATKHKVIVCNIPDYGIQEVASHAMAMMMALTRKIEKMNQSVKSGRWAYAESIPIYRYSNMTYGIIGVGRIGSCFAHMIRPLGGRILCYDIESQHIQFDFVERVSFEKLLKESDVISIHTNLETSRGLIGKDELKQMKSNAVIINVSRGGIIIENDLVEALNSNTIAGAALDVICQEPLTNDNLLLTAKNLILTPHMAWYSQESSLDLKTKAAEEAVRFVLGKKIKNQVHRF